MFGLRASMDDGWTALLAGGVYTQVVPQRKGHLASPCVSAAFLGLGSHGTHARTHRFPPWFMMHGCRAELDEDVPGYGKHYCIACARYFQNAISLSDHEATKPHKRRVKMLMTTAKPHNQRDAEAAAGIGAPDNGPKLRSQGPAAMQQ